MYKTSSFRSCCFLLGIVLAMQATPAFAPRSTQARGVEYGVVPDNLPVPVATDEPLARLDDTRPDGRHPYEPNHKDHRQRQLPGDALQLPRPAERR